MPNDHVEIHDPFSNHNHLNGDSTSDPESMEDTVEHRILMAYAQRRRPKEPSKSEPEISPVDRPGNPDIKGPSSPETPAKVDTEVKKKKKWKGLKRILTCITPQIKDKEPVQTPSLNEDPVTDRCFTPAAENQPDEETELEHVAGRLVDLADEIPFRLEGPDTDLATDAPDDEELETVIGLLLRDTGDKLNEGVLKDVNFGELFLNYGFFSRLMTTFLMRMGLMDSEPDALGPHASPKTQIAMACEVTSRLSFMETAPEREVIRHGARYLQENFSSWADQQGGYEKAFEADLEDEVD